MIQKVAISEADQELLATAHVDPSAIEDDFCDYSKVVVKKPWGYEYLIFSNGITAVWILYLNKSSQTSMHCHPQKKTSLIVLQGEVVCSTVNREFLRTAGSGLSIDKGVFHQTSAVSDSGAFVMEVETPVNKRDLVRLRDRYAS